MVFSEDAAKYPGNCLANVLSRNEPPKYYLCETASNVTKVLGGYDVVAKLYNALTLNLYVVVVRCCAGIATLSVSLYIYMLFSYK